MTFYQDEQATLYQGNSLEVLKTLPAESVDMVMTSPPYYGLRSYKASPVIWGGQDGCQHEWGDTKEHLLNMKSGNPEFERPWREGATATVTNGNFCTLCNAWRGQLGSEPTPDLFISHLCDIFDEVKRVLKPTGSIYVNLDDSHAGSGKASGQSIDQVSAKQATNFASAGLPAKVQGIPAKSLIGIPARFQLEMINRDWICRNVIIWHKESVMPESVKDRFTIDFEYVFMFSKQQHYFFERQFEPIADSSVGRGPVDFGGQKGRDYIPADSDPNFRNGSEQWGRTYDYTKSSSLGRNKRTLWTINPQGFKGEHYATYPEELCRTPIEASCPEFICTKCGQARVKVYEKGFTDHDGTINSKPDPGDKLNGSAGRLALLRQASRENGGEYENDTKQIGLSSCTCENPTYDPGVCLDPFSGTATTGVMAKKLGRHYIGIEVSEKYNQMAIKRLQATTNRLL